MKTEALNIIARQHPDLFSAEEACMYLHLQPGQKCTIETLRESGKLKGAKIGREYFYHRRDLDELVERIFLGEVQAPMMDELDKPMRMASQEEHQERIRKAEVAQPAKGPKLKFNGRVATEESA